MKRILIVLSLVLVLFGACSVNTVQEEDLKNETSIFNPDKEVGFSYQTYCEDNGGYWNEVSNDCEGISKEVCEVQNGTYNECASACRGTDAEVCTLQCVFVCEFDGSSTSDKLLDSYGNEIDKACSVWNDGCNTCQVTENGLSCTKKFCSEEALEEPVCLEYE